MLDTLTTFYFLIKLVGSPPNVFGNFKTDKKKHWMVGGAVGFLSAGLAESLQKQ